MPHGRWPMPDVFPVPSLIHLRNLEVVRGDERTRQSRGKEIGLCLGKAELLLKRTRELSCTPLSENNVAENAGEVADLLGGETMLTHARSPDYLRGRLVEKQTAEVLWEVVGDWRSGPVCATIDRAGTGREVHDEVVEIRTVRH